MKRTIMIIEDTPEMSELITIFLQREGFNTVCFDTAEKALEALSLLACDLIVLDINLPGIDGFEFLARLRKFTDIPVLIITARRSDQDIITGLGYGADDFISKPFSSGVVIARIRALLRRSDKQIQDTNKKTRFGPYVFDSSAFTLFKNNSQIPLSMRECKLLDYLISNAEKSSSPETIYDKVWKNKFGDLTIVAVYIQRLRRKIEKDPSAPVYILTKQGYGYSFHIPEQEGTEKKTHEN